MAVTVEEMKKTKIELVRNKANSLAGVRLVKAFSQSLGSELAELTELEQRGACRALCLQWIIHRHQGKDFWAIMEEKTIFRQIIHQQRSWDKSEKRNQTQEDWIALVLSTAGLRIRRALGRVPIDPAIIIQDNYPYHLYRAIWRPKGAHAMAAHFEGPWVSFFDPNLGHFHCDSRNAYGHLLNDVIFAGKQYGTGKTLKELWVREIAPV